VPPVAAIYRHSGCSHWQRSSVIAAFSLQYSLQQSPYFPLAETRHLQLGWAHFNLAVSRFLSLLSGVMVTLLSH
jgi:hypothetical protein